MRIPRIHQHPIAAPGSELVLNDLAARHVLSVLRLKPGAALIVFNGLGQARQAQLVRASRHEVTVLLGDDVPANSTEAELKVTVALGVSRGERMDIAIQKSVELGVSRIIPLLTERTVVKLHGDRAEKRRTHWRGVIVGACEQCGRNVLPEIAPVQRFTDWLGSTRDEGLRLMLDPHASQGLAQTDHNGQNPVTLLIGPEGGISAKERDLARQFGFSGVRLGPRVLRTETAVIAAMSAIMTLWGDLGN